MADLRPILLSAGGTGGHLFPAFALAEELTRRGRIVDVVTDERGDRYWTGFPGRAMHHVPSATLASNSPLAMAGTVATLGKGVLAARSLLKKLNPSVVVGFGGYPTFPPLVAARLAGIPSVVHEANAVMGRANRMLVKRVTALAASWEGTKNIPEGALGKVRVTGNPVRDAVIAAAATPYPALSPATDVRLLVFGGSQGARYFSDTVPPALAGLPDAARRRLRVTQQCREEDLERVRAAYAQSGITAELAPFFKDLPQRMAAAHLVVARSGASSVSELTVLGRPSILVPLPHALDNDQLNNATRLAEAGAAWCIEQKSLTPQRLGTEIAALIDSPDRLMAAAVAAKRAGKPDAVKLLADLVEQLAGAS
jgi:UDP-N-acetylglucosamine--N-acetylmuramyl-(pentapeptide) pyrophosphoryl-undecaprenol N-acetylglucosamine transferase